MNVSCHNFQFLGMNSNGTANSAFLFFIFLELQTRLLNSFEAEVHGHGS